MMLTLALAPAKQFYLAWFGLVPWLWVVRDAKTTRRAFFWSWLAGTAFFGMNLWWLVYVTVPGAITLVIYLGLYWGFAAMIVRRWLRRETPRAPAALLALVLGFATVWAGLEFVRGNLFTGLPWLYLGHTQSPLLIACQIADVFGVYGISFCVAAVNALVFLYFVTPARPSLGMATAAVGGLWLASCLYGALRLSPTSALGQSTTVLVVQPNYPQSNKGEKGASEAEMLQFHLDATTAGVQQAAKVGKHVDLVCWSETVMPGLNEYYRAMWRGIPLIDRDKKELEHDRGATLDQMAAKVGDLARDLHISVLTGGVYEADLDEHRGIFRDRRNSAYLFLADGSLAAERYDKIHLVPFGEFIPFKHSTWFHWLYTFFNSFSPYDFDYTLTAGPDDSPAVFTIPPPQPRGTAPVRFVAPICFEDIDSRLVARMFRGDGRKRADLIVNLTNDGWFKYNENPQHLQAAIFRSIENRAPTARSVNTGISAVIDSCGRVTERVAQSTAGSAFGSVVLDPRYTLYSRWGDWFAGLCVLVTAAFGVRGTVRWYRTRPARRT
jgi:apolipoprotein N-acyltransferase